VVANVNTLTLFNANELELSVGQLVNQDMGVLDVHWRAPNSLRDSNVSLKLETTEEQRVRAAPWLATLRGVEGCAGASGWDEEELTSFNYSHERAQTQHEVVNA
jgi:hypothetical protein